MSILRIGLVGRRSSSLLEGLRSQPGVEISAFCEIDRSLLESVSSKYSIPLTFTKFEDMLENVDVAVIGTPMQLHVPQALAALQAGCSVLSEVTAAVSLEECWRLLDAVSASGKTYMMSENYCYIRENVLIKEMVRKGLFGDPYYGEGQYLHEFRKAHHTPEGSPTWRYYWQVGMNGCTYGTHSLGPVMQWFSAADKEDRIETVTCLGSGRHTDTEHPHDDTSTMLCKMKSGKLINVRLDMMSNRPHAMRNYALQGTKGAYESSRADGDVGRIWVGESITDEHRSWRPLTDFEEHLPESWLHPPEEALRAGHGGGDYYVASDFINAIRNGSPPPIDVYTSLEWTAAGLCSQISIENGGVPIHVPNFRDPSQRPLWLDGRLKGADL